ncbi:aminoacyl-tRNA hydrolase [Alkalihalobacillus sp. BA299]|uniref:aminoacyl-tRNA hydrolase n=1 Tax=Alkalihalobacillus sp. BA299 TaxID=2815938 RepID=UPI001ADAE002|nr:aminoacyl-tRNA hydrolase [Alkalihalobacillus sp. BA299]
MKLIVGLGNPGTKYENTRHNAGFMVIDECAEMMGIELKDTKYKGVYGSAIVDGEKVFLLKPLTYMNLSGECVRPFMDYFKIDIEDVVIIFDDMDLSVGQIRLRQKGGHGGHNGIKSLNAHLGTNEFKRIRIGVERPEPGVSVVNHVLGTFRAEERDLLTQAVKKASEACRYWLQNDFPNVMNHYN